MLFVESKTSKFDNPSNSIGIDGLECEKSESVSRWLRWSSKLISVADLDKSLGDLREKFSSLEFDKSLEVNLVAVADLLDCNGSLKNSLLKFKPVSRTKSDSLDLVSISRVEVFSIGSMISGSGVVMTKYFSTIKWSGSILQPQGWPLTLVSSAKQYHCFTSSTQFSSGNANVPILQLLVPQAFCPNSSGSILIGFGDSNCHPNFIELCNLVSWSKVISPKSSILICPLSSSLTFTFL